VLLARDLLALRGHCVGLRIGGGIEAAELDRLPEDAQTPYLRMLTYSLGEKAAAPMVDVRTLVPVAPAIAKDRLAQSVAELPAGRHLYSHRELSVYLAPASEMPPVMDEIARLRELSFRLVGEGTGRDRDTDDYDRHYQHLFVWHRDRHEIVGAYRLGFCDEIVQRRGVGGLYTHTLFDFEASLFRRLGPSIELGRSFVSPDWQKSFNPLRMLWGGIASICAARPEIRYLFGPVSISPSYSVTGRALMSDVLARHYSDPELRDLVRPRNPPRRKRAPESHRNVVSALADASLLSRVVARVENGPGLPVLVRQYLELNGRFASFNVDDAFGGTLDGLVFVEISRIPPHIFARYLRAGRPEDA
jgi:putative hemolysin